MNIDALFCDGTSNYVIPPEPKKNEKRVRDTSLWKFTRTDDRKVWGISPVS